MNVRKGMRRLGILLGVSGAVLGGYLAYDDARAVWNSLRAYRRFESIAASPTMGKVAKAVLDYQREYWKAPWAEFRETTGQVTYADGRIREDVPPSPPGGTGAGEARVTPRRQPPVPEGTILVSVNLEGITGVTADKAGLISSIELSTGESVQKADPPALKSYLIPLLYPILGFLLPWGAVPVLIWVGSGFFVENRR